MGRGSGRAREVEDRAIRQAARDKGKVKLKIQLSTARVVPAEERKREAPNHKLLRPNAWYICPEKLMAPFVEKSDDLNAYFRQYES